MRATHTADNKAILADWLSRTRVPPGKLKHGICEQRRLSSSYAFGTYFQYFKLRQIKLGFLNETLRTQESMIRLHVCMQSDPGSMCLQMPVCVFY